MNRRTSAIGRRQFVAATGGLLAGALLPTPFSGRRRRLDRIGVQLYTVRQAMERDMAGTLARVAAIGFTEVEFAGYFNHPASEVSALLRRNGLTAPAGHMPWPEDDDAWQRTLDFAAAVEHEYAIIAWTPAEIRRTLDDWRRVAERFNHLAEAARRSGLGFAYHNHDFEFARMEGQVPFDLLLRETDPGLVRMEMDIYWITLAGGEPLEYFRRYPGRWPMVHVKDLKRGARPEMVDVGRGDIDFEGIFARHREAGIQHYFVEHDEPADPFASIEASFRYLKTVEL